MCKSHSDALKKIMMKDKAKEDDEEEYIRECDRFRALTNLYKVLNGENKVLNGEIITQYRELWGKLEEMLNKEELWALARTSLLARTRVWGSSEDESSGEEVEEEEEAPRGIDLDAMD